MPSSRGECGAPWQQRAVRASRIKIRCFRMSDCRDMNDPGKFRMERIEKLFYELRYEIERGIMERQIDEDIAMRFYVPISNKIPGGLVLCEIRTRPVPFDYPGGNRLRLVEK